MECKGTTYVGRVEDDLGTIQVVFCDACRTIAVDAGDSHRRSWRITYPDPETAGLDRGIDGKERLWDRASRTLRRALYGR